MKKFLARREFFHVDLKQCSSHIVSKEFSSLQNESSSELDREVISISNAENKMVTRRKDITTPGADDICRILSGPWGQALEEELSSVDKEPQAELVIGVLKRLSDVNLAINYFRWVEQKDGQVHRPEAYDCLLKVMARSKRFENFEQVLEEMSIAGSSSEYRSCRALS